MPLWTKASGSDGPPPGDGPEDRPDRPANIVLTGASSGIGAAAAVALTGRGHAVLALGRCAKKLERVHCQMLDAAPSPSDVPAPLSADFSSFADVHRAARHVSDLWDRVDVLVNNAGIEMQRRELSQDGFELVFAVNHLAPFLFTNLLLGVIRASAGRIVTTASSNHADGVLDLTDLQMERGWSTRASYDRSKLANVLFTSELSRRTKLPASAFHPGSVRTDLNRHAPLIGLRRPIERVLYDSPEVGSKTLIWLATSTEGAHPRAVYYERHRPRETSPAARDTLLARALWNLSSKLVGLDALDGSREETV
jgi:NAD(P)-dependent dehydrogenase (short-subunit alcohol dehydrogenase family)